MNTFPIKRIVVCFVLLSFIVPFACKKSGSAPSLSFSIRGMGVYCIGQPMCFSESPIAASSYLWNFGDGATSTDAAPCHTYTDTGTYIVKLTINNNTSQAKQLQLHIGTQPIFTYLLNGTKIWHHQLGIQEHGYPPSFFGPAPDTSLSIVSIDATTIVVGSDTLKYEVKTPYNDSALYFNWDFSPGTTVFAEIHEELYFKHGVTDSFSYHILYDESPGETQLSYFFLP